MACEIFVPLLAIEPAPPALEVQNLNYWMTREVPGIHSLYLTLPAHLQMYPVYSETGTS